MSNKTKRLAKGLGASALAVATIASGLSFGATAASAAKLSERAIHKIIFEGSSASEKRYAVITGFESTNRWAVLQTDSLSEARASGADFEVPRFGSSGHVAMLSNPNVCLALGSDFGTVIRRTCSASDTQQNMSWEEHNRAGRSGFTLVSAGSQAGFTYRENETSLGATTKDSASHVITPFNGEVSSVDIPGRSAVVSGRGEPGATVVLQWGDGEYEDETPVNAEGVWDFELKRLKLGSNPVKLLQYENQQVTGEYDLDVELEISDLTVTHEFGADVKDPVTLSGTAQGGAVVQVFNDDDQMVVASEPANQTTGAWSVQVPAPNKGGAYDLNVYQSLQGERTSKTPVSIDYGKQLVVTRPADGGAHAGGKLDVRGTGEPGATVQVHEGDRLVGGPKQVRATGNWDIETIDLDAREHRLTVTQESKGGNVQTDTIVLNEGESSVPAPTAEVVFDADVTQKAKIVGSAQAGATVTIRDSRNAVVGTPQVVNGQFELALTGAFGSQDYTITQSINGETSPETVVRAEFGQAMEVAATNTNGTVTVTGTSSQGAKITLTSGGREFAALDVTNTDGTFSRDLTGLGQGEIVITATAKSKGALSSTDTAGLSLPVTAASVTFTSHPDRTFTPGPLVFAGKATPGATITLNPFGWEPAYAAYDLTTTVDQFGDWQISRGLGNTTYALFSIKQTAQQGVTNELNRLNMRPYAEVGEPADLTVNFTAGDFFTPGQQTFAGRATPGAQVTLNPFGFTNPAYAGYDITVLADSTGQWSIPRSLGNTTYRELAVKQDSPDASKVNLIENIFLAPTGWLGDPADLTDTTTSFTHTPGQAFTFTGTARPGTTVTLYPFGTEYPDYALTTTVKATGTWSITRQLGNQVFPVVITQDNAEGKTDRIEHTMTPTTK